MSGGFGIDVGAVTTPRALHTAQLVAVQLHFPVLVDDEALAAACLQEAKADHSSAVPCTRSAVMVSHFLCPSVDYKGCRVIDLLFEDIHHHLQLQEVLVAHLRIEARRDVQQLMN